MNPIIYTLKVFETNEKDDERNEELMIRHRDSQQQNG